MTGYAADAPAFAERALAIGEGLGDLPLRVAASYYLGTAYFVSGDYRRTDEFFPKILQLLEGDLVRERCGLAGLPSVMSRFFWTSALIERGEFDQGMVQAQEGIRLAEALDHPYSLTHALLVLGRLHGAKGDLGHAIRLTERGLALSREWILTQLSPMVGDVLGYFYAQSGRVAEGVTLLEEALRAMESMAMIQWRSPLIARLGETYLLASRPEDALTLMRRGLTLAREHGHRGSEAWAFRVPGEIASHGGHPDLVTAEAHYSAALALASELGMRPLVAHCHLGLGKLYRRSGKREQVGPSESEALITPFIFYRSSVILKAHVRFDAPERHQALKESGTRGRRCRGKAACPGVFSRSVSAAALGVLLLGATVGSDAATPSRGREAPAPFREEVHNVPVAGTSIVMTSFRPLGKGPYPWIILSHGTAVTIEANRALGRYRPLHPISEWIKRGYAVLVPVRRGYGASGGPHLGDDYGSCAKPDYRRAGEGAALDLLATLEWARSQRDLDPGHWMLVGQSAGAFASIYTASKHPAGLVAVLAFAPGRGGNPDTRPGEPCGSDLVATLFASIAPRITVPVLWFYAENDQFIGKRVQRLWFDSFRAAGGAGELVVVPPFPAARGHGVFPSDAGTPLWTAAVGRFFTSQHLAMPF